jgi:hypothetical protein
MSTSSAGEGGRAQIEGPQIHIDREDIGRVRNAISARFEPCIAIGAAFAIGADHSALRGTRIASEVINSNLSSTANQVRDLREGIERLNSISTELCDKCGMVSRSLKETQDMAREITMIPKSFPERLAIFIASLSRRIMNLIRGTEADSE